MSGKLTPKQAMFCREYLVDLNGAAAARRAGYSVKTADQAAINLLGKSWVKEEIARLMEERSRAVQWDAQEVLRRLIEEANADIADLYGPNGDLKPVHEWPAVWRRGLVGGIKIEALFEGTGEDRTQIGHSKEVKISDRIKRLELIGKHVAVGAFKDKVEHNVSDPLKDLLKEISGHSFKPKEG